MGLRDHDLSDAYRWLNGFAENPTSYIPRGRHPKRRRYDHVYASQIGAGRTRCGYREDWLDGKLVERPRRRVGRARSPALAPGRREPRKELGHAGAQSCVRPGAGACVPVPAEASCPSLTGRRSGLRRWTHGSDVTASARRTCAIPSFHARRGRAAGRYDRIHRWPERRRRRRDLVGGDDVAAQTQQVMKNLHIALAASAPASRTW